jgi:phosphatidylserine/phosphatidylglycerophosphate/cardiolipin synthase-like enzyme
MHNKFAVIDNSVVIMGSFNWTGQAVKYNQENIFFYEDKNIASQYTEEFEKLWNSFNTVIDQKSAQKAVEDEAKEEEEKKKAKAEKKKANEDKKTNTKTVKEQKIEKSESKKQTTKRVRGVKNN